MAFLPVFQILAPYLVAAVVALFVTWELVRDLKGNQSRLPLAAGMVALALWSILGFFEDGSSRVQDKLFFSNLEFWASGAVPVLFFLFALGYASPKEGGWRRSPGFAVTLLIVPFATGLAALIQPVDGLIRRGVHFEVQAGALVFREDYTPVFWLFLAYGYVLMAAALVLWALKTLRDRSKRYWTVRWTFATVMVAAGVNLLSVLGLEIWPGHDLTAPCFVVTGVAFWLALDRNQLLSVLPTARETVMESWPGPLAVFDSQDALAFFNTRAGEVWHLNDQLLGRKRRDLSMDLASPSPKPLADPSSGQFWKVEERPLEEGTDRRGTLVTGHDVTALMTRVTDEFQHRRRTEEQVFYYSLHDSLTGLANRALFLSRLEKARDRTLVRRGGIPVFFGVILVDLNRFGQVNETWGPATGDELLVQVALRLASAIRGEDTVARASGGRFLVLLGELASEPSLWETSERLRAAVETPVALPEATMIPSVRMGMVLGTGDEPTPESILANAEMALDQSGADRTAPTVLFAPALRTARNERRILKKDLEDSLVRGDLHLLFQPIIDLGSGEVRGFEALSRWNHRTRGFVPPDVFIPIAEAEGTIQPLGLWVLREASRLFADLGNRYPVVDRTFVAVNVSPLQLIEPDFVSILLGILAREGLDPRRLHLEITETSLVESSDRIVPVFETLRREGIRIKLDDFGTGYSSLNALHRLPVDTLKVDQSFVRSLEGSRPIVKMILGLARELGLDTVAEGVETAGQESTLADLGCRHGQGFLYSRGWTAEGLETLYRDDPQGPRYGVDKASPNPYNIDP
jgi:diguanylate cyclase (GGDEF)-like protein